jgi:5-hydroxyisourate hydrolase-like protein (transthyretin family)
MKALAGRFRLIGVLILVVLCSSCSKESRRRVCYPVVGQVLVRGQPAAGMLVVLYPANDSDAGAPSVSGTTDDEGRFALSTYETEDGAPAGEYAVAIRRANGLNHKGAFKKSPEPERKNRYLDPKTSGLRVRIEERPNELAPFNLQ